MANLNVAIGTLNGTATGHNLSVELKTIRGVPRCNQSFLVYPGKPKPYKDEALELVP